MHKTAEKYAEKSEQEFHASSESSSGTTNCICRTNGQEKSYTHPILREDDSHKNSYQQFSK